MPDWSYRTLLRPALLGLGPERAQRVAVRTLSILGSHPFGLALIDFMGHMRVDPRLEVALNKAAAEGWTLLFQVVEQKRFMLFWKREAVILTLAR